MIRVTDAMLPRVRTYLNAHAEFTMFPLANLDQHGLDGDHPRSPRIWVNAAGTDVLCVSREGMVMPFLPSGKTGPAVKILQTLGPLVGMIGPAAHVRALQSACGLDAAPTTMNEDEPQFILPLDDLIIPDGIGTLIPLIDAPEAVIRDWMADYERHALHTPEDKIAAQVDASYGARIATGSHMALMDGDTCLAKTGFNAALPDIVQIGGVYTPPALRGRGHARRAVALHLEQARASGVHRATLFSASDMAARAYRSIGFRQIGDWTLMLFASPQVVHA